MPTPSPTAPEYFGRMVESYDSFIRRAVPRYEEMTERLVEHLPARAERILELGCGTGNLTLRLLERFADARVTAVDAAPEMTALTAARASERGLGSRLRAVTARFEDLVLDAASFDLVASCMSLHHVRGTDSLYRSFARWLAAGGALRFGDMARGATEAAQQAFWDRWLEFCRLPGHCTEEEIAGLVEHAAAHDHYLPLADHFRLLREAGFSNIDCVWRNLMYIVVVADH